MRVLLIAGGWSSERDVALSGARSVEAALLRLGHTVERLDPQTDFLNITAVAQQCDFAFILMHGSPGEDGLVQAMLDAANVPYQGAGPGGSFLALHKAAAKQIFRGHGLLTADWEYLPRRPGPDWRPTLSFPIFIKDNAGGSSLDMAMVATLDELRAAMENLFSKGREVLLEQALPGVELTCAVVGGEALPPILIRPRNAAPYFDYESKYAQDGAEEICPAPVAPELCRELMEMSLAAHAALGLRGYSRADFMLHDDALYLLEVNTIPGMTPTSLLPKAAAAVGMDFDQLIARLMELGLATATPPQKGSNPT